MLLTIMFNHTVVFASADPPSNEKAVVFLFDASGSMEANDPEKLALDSAVQLVYSLPSDYKVGVVAYANDVVLQTELVNNAARNSLASEIETIQYEGYSNAGAGLESALNLLSDVENSHIVMLSDGEILLNSEKTTTDARDLFSTQVERAKTNGIEVHFIALADETLIDSEISKVSYETGGSNHYAVLAEEIQTAIDKILLDELEVKKTSLGVTNTKEGVSDIAVNLLAGSGISRILITSTGDIGDLVADFEAESAMQDVGKRYAFIELTNPMSDTINLHLESDDNGEISVDIISEFSPSLKATVTYMDALPEDDESTHYIRTANIEISFISEKGKPIFTEAVFENLSLEVLINGEKQTATMLDGKLSVTKDVVTAETLEIDIDLTSLPLNLMKLEVIQVDLDGPPIVEVIEPDYRPTILAVCAGLAILVLILMLKPKKIVMATARKKVEEPISKYSYTGKLNIYITRTKKDLDFPPLTFNLFHISNSRRISLSDILEKLDIKEIFEGAEHIYFSPSANRKLIVTNESDSTIMKSREILLKGKSIELFADSKLDITFEDEVSELMLQYRDTK